MPWYYSNSSNSHKTNNWIRSKHKTNATNLYILLGPLSLAENDPFLKVRHTADQIGIYLFLWLTKALDHWPGVGNLRPAIIQRPAHGWYQQPTSYFGRGSFRKRFFSYKKWLECVLAQQIFLHSMGVGTAGILYYIWVYGCRNPPIGHSCQGGGGEDGAGYRVLLGAGL